MGVSTRTEHTILYVGVSTFIFRCLFLVVARRTVVTEQFSIIPFLRSRSDQHTSVPIRHSVYPVIPHIHLFLIYIYLARGAVRECVGARPPQRYLSGLFRAGGVHSFSRKAAEFERLAV